MLKIKGPMAPGLHRILGLASATEQPKTGNTRWGFEGSFRQLSLRWKWESTLLPLETRTPGGASSIAFTAIIVKKCLKDVAPRAPLTVDIIRDLAMFIFNERLN